MTGAGKRGRPRGDGGKDDAALLKIATRVASGEPYDLAAAAVYQTHAPKAKHVRKTVMDGWRRKWAVRKDALLTKTQAPKPRVVDRSAALYGSDDIVLSLRQMVESTPNHMLQKMIEGTSQHQFEKLLKSAGLTIEGVHEQSRMAIETFNQPHVQETLKFMQAPEFRSLISEFKKFHS